MSTGIENEKLGRHMRPCPIYRRPSVKRLSSNLLAIAPAVIWELKCFFVKDGEGIEAVPGDLTPFYTKYKGRNTGIAAMLKNGWTLQNEIGCELTPEQAKIISKKIKEHGK